MYSIEKTRACRNVLKYGVCRRDICSFAHFLEELNIPSCNNKSCINEQCKYIHTSETIDSYKYRVNYVPPSLPSELEFQQNIAYRKRLFPVKHKNTTLVIDIKDITDETYGDIVKEGLSNGFTTFHFLK